jgi:predicted nucleotidyltransferase
MVKKTIPLKIKKNIQSYIKELKKDKLPIKKVILFGSYAKGIQHKWSDIDICVISPAFKKKDAIEYLWTKKKIRRHNGND